jgi:tRNA (cmo5U34)-methyltransferase
MPRRSRPTSSRRSSAPPRAPAEPVPAWTDDNSADFLAFGAAFVPDREEQFDTLVRLIPASSAPQLVLDLGCGEGGLAEMILEAHPSAVVCGLDSSETMLRAAGARLARFGERFVPELRKLEDLAGWTPPLPLLAAVSSLAIHHLDEHGKQALFGHIRRRLQPGGAIVIADLIAPASPAAGDMAADRWDDAVRSRSMALYGSSQAYEFFLREHWNAHRYLEPDDIDKPSRIFDQLHWLEAAGFTAVDVYWMRAGHAIFGGVTPPAA